MTPKSKEHEQAFNLFFQTDFTQKQIADILNIDRKTLFTWAKEGDWKRAKDTIRHAPSFLVEQYYDQLNNINRSIAERTERPYPTKEEATIIKTISATIKQIGVRQSASEAIDVFTDFGLEVCRYDHAFARKMILYMDKYVRQLSDHDNERYRSKYYWQSKKDKEYEQYLAEQAELAKPDEAQRGDNGEMKGESETTINTCNTIPIPNSEFQVPSKRGDNNGDTKDEPETNTNTCKTIPIPNSQFPIPGKNGAIMGSSSQTSESTKPATEATNQNNNDSKNEEKRGNGAMNSREPNSNNLIQIPNSEFPIPKKNGVMNSNEANINIPEKERFLVPIKELKKAPLIITNCVGRYVIAITDIAGRIVFKTTSRKPEEAIDLIHIPRGTHTVTITDSAGKVYTHEILVSH